MLHMGYICIPSALNTAWGVGLAVHSLFLSLCAYPSYAGPTRDNQAHGNTLDLYSHPFMLHGWVCIVLL